MSEKDVRRAFAKREATILKNLATMTLKTLRQQLAKDLGTDPDALKPHRDLISGLIDELISRQQGASTNQDAPAPRPKAAETQPPKPKPGKVMHSAPEVEEVSVVPPPSPTALPKLEGTAKYSRSTERMRAVCRQATISIPPSLYARNKGKGMLEAALQQLLGKHGLDEHSAPSEVSRVKSRLQRERELDGIDTSNIVAGGRSRRAAYAAQPVSGLSSSESEEQEESGSSHESDESDRESTQWSGQEPSSGESEERPRTTGPRAEKQDRKEGPAESASAEDSSNATETSSASSSSSSSESEDESKESSASDGESVRNAKPASKTAKPAPAKRRRVQIDSDDESE